MLKVLGGDVSEGPLKEMGIHSFINVHIHIKLKVDGGDSDIYLSGAR